MFKKHILYSCHLKEKMSLPRLNMTVKIITLREARDRENIDLRKNEVNRLS